MAAPRAAPHREIRKLSGKSPPSWFTQLSASLREPDPAALYRNVSAFVAHRFSARRGPMTLLSSVALFTLVAMGAALIPFLLRRPGALQGRMWGQFLLHGFPVTFLVNSIAALFYSVALPHLTSGSVRYNALVLLADFVCRMLLFAALLSLSFVLWAVTVGAFAGTPSTALEAVLPSIRYGIAFDSLTGVYLYAMVLNAFPFFALFFIPLFAASAGVRARLPDALTRLRPMGTVVVFFVLWYGLAMLASYLLLAAIEGQLASA